MLKAGFYRKLRNSFYCPGSTGKSIDQPLFSRLRRETDLHVLPFINAEAFINSEIVDSLKGEIPRAASATRALLRLTPCHQA